MEFNYSPDQLIKMQNKYYLDEIFLLAEDCLTLHEEFTKVKNELIRYKDVFGLVARLGAEPNE